MFVGGFPFPPKTTSSLGALYKTGKIKSARAVVGIQAVPLHFLSIVITAPTLGNRLAIVIIPLGDEGQFRVRKTFLMIVIVVMKKTNGGISIISTGLFPSTKVRASVALEQPPVVATSRQNRVVWHFVAADRPCRIGCRVATHHTYSSRKNYCSAGSKSR